MNNYVWHREWTWGSVDIVTEQDLSSVKENTLHALFSNHEQYQKQVAGLISGLQEKEVFVWQSKDIFEHHFFTLFFPICIRDIYSDFSKLAFSGTKIDVNQYIIDHLYSLFAKKMDEKDFVKYLLSDTADERNSFTTLSDFEKELTSKFSLVPHKD